MKNKAAQQLGRKGGKTKTEAKAEAARANGAKGGRPLTKISTKHPLRGGVGAGVSYTIHDSIDDTLLRIAQDAVESHRVVTRFEVRDSVLLIQGHQRANGLYPVTLEIEIDQQLSDRILVG